MLFMIAREDCPYCAEAKRNLAELLCVFPQFQKIPVCFAEEGARIFAEWDYYYLPAYFRDKEKLAEGEYTREDLKKILDRAYLPGNFGQDNQKKGERYEAKSYPLDLPADGLHRCGTAGELLCPKGDCGTCDGRTSADCGDYGSGDHLSL